MTKNTPKIATASPEEVAQFAGETPPDVAAPTNGATGAPAAVPHETEVLRAQLAELRDKYLRAQAECVNVARRVNEEKAQAVRMANAAFARDLLNVVDDLERTLASVEGRDDEDPLVHGVRLILESLLKVLRSHQVRPIEALGQPFDPTLHEAVMNQPAHGLPEGTVLSELAKGYRIHDQLLRACKVAVAGRAEPTARTPTENSDADV